jgi:hypothetical protein
LLTFSGEAHIFQSACLVGHSGLCGPRPLLAAPPGPHEHSSPPPNWLLEIDGGATSLRRDTAAGAVAIEWHINKKTLRSSARLIASLRLERRLLFFL